MNISRTKIGIALAAMLALIVASFLAGRALTASGSEDGGEEAAPQTVTVETASVGRSLTFMTTVTRTSEPLAANALTGTVTSIADADSFDTGAVLYSVNTQPVRVIPGSIAHYRGLAEGDKGVDVTDLQNALAHLGYSPGAANGTYGPSTTRAVKAWQRDLGIEQTGAIGHGELVVVPSTPATLTLDPKIIHPGLPVAGGELGILHASGPPDFTMSLTKNQGVMIPSDTSLTVTSGEHQWPAIIAETRANDSGGTDLILTAPDGSPVCADACDQIPASGTLSLPTAIVIVEPVSGPALPVAAVSVGADGRAHVTLEVGDGTEERAVTVLGTQDGVAVVDGLQEGDMVRFPSTPSTPPAQRPGQSPGQAPGGSDDGRG
ncbi:MAG: peptidoglycan-binding domain-containing protein [Dermabacter sp.]|nr:peptidoglycan-binding domain-containing protein [Dermabacter sp.]